MVFALCAAVRATVKARYSCGQMCLREAGPWWEFRGVGCRCWGAGALPAKPPFHLGSAWHREVSGDSDVITAITFFRCGALLVPTPNSPNAPTLPFASLLPLPSAHFRRAFTLNLFFQPFFFFKLMTSLGEVSSASLSAHFADDTQSPTITLKRLRAHAHVDCSVTILWRAGV